MNHTNTEYHQPQRHDDEIDLAELFLILWKRKILIVAVTILATIAALAVTMILPEVYEISASIQPGKDAEGQLVEDPQEIQGKIVNGAYNDRLVELHNLPRKQIPTFQASVLKEINSVKISAESAEPEHVAGILQKLAELIEDDLQQSLKDKILEAKLEAKSRITKVQLELNLLQSQIQRIQKQLPQTRKRLAELEQQRKKAMESVEDVAIKFLLFSKEIHNRQIFLNDLEEKLSGYLVEKEHKILEREQLEADFADIEPTDNIRQQPFIAQTPVKPKKTLIVALTFVTALMASVMLAFAAEFFSRVRKQYAAQVS